MKLTQLELKIVIEKYEKLIEIPKKISLYQFILAPVGLVGSGKTTVIRPLSRYFSLIRISSDEVRVILKSLYNTSYTQNDVLYIITFLLKKYIKMGYGVAIDSNCENKKDLISKLIKEFNIKVIWININPPESFILEKLANMNYLPGHVFKDANQALNTYLKDKPIQRNLDMNFLSEIDTSKKDLEREILDTQNKIENFLK